MQYFEMKQRRLRGLSSMADARTGALMLSSHCCMIARVIWSNNRSLIGMDDMADLFVDHAQRSFELVSSILESVV